jgi:hypothetical protein
LLEKKIQLLKKLNLKKFSKPGLILKINKFCRLRRVPVVKNEVLRDNKIFEEAAQELSEEIGVISPEAVMEIHFRPFMGEEGGKVINISPEEYVKYIDHMSKLAEEIGIPYSDLVLMHHRPYGTEVAENMPVPSELNQIVYAKHMYNSSSD